MKIDIVFGTIIGWLFILIVLNTLINVPLCKDFQGLNKDNNEFFSLIKPDSNKYDIICKVKAKEFFPNYYREDIIVNFINESKQAALDWGWGEYGGYVYIVKPVE